MSQPFSISIVDNRLHVRLGNRFSPALLDFLKSRVDPRRRFEPAEKAWSFPNDPMIARKLAETFGADALPTEAKASILTVPECRVEISAAAKEQAASATWGMKPYAHQLGGLAEIIQEKSWGLFWEMGCGKSAPVAVFINQALSQGLFNGHVLILGPLSVIGVWSSVDTRNPGELAKHGGVRCQVAAGKPDHRKAVLRRLAESRQPPQVCVTNYETLLSEQDLMRAVPWDCIVTDEGHRIRNVGTKTFKNLMKLAWDNFALNIPKARYRIALTGTPAPNGPTSLFGIGVFLRGRDAFGTVSKTSFESRYAVFGGYDAKQIVAYQNTDELSRLVSRFSSRLRKDDCLELPDRVVIVQKVTMSPHQQQVYKDLRSKAVARLAGGGPLCPTCRSPARMVAPEGVPTTGATRDGSRFSPATEPSAPVMPRMLCGKGHTFDKADALLSQVSAQNVLVERLRLLQIACGHVPEDDTEDGQGRVVDLHPNSKLDALMGILEDAPKPVVIWSPFRASVDAIAKSIADSGLGSVDVFHGGRNQSERQEIINKFQGGELDYFVGTPQSGGSGITLTRAGVEIFYAKTDNAVDIWQAGERVHRLGQKKKVTQFHLVADKTVDEKVHDALSRKLTMQEMVTSFGIEDLL